MADTLRDKLAVALTPFAVENRTPNVWDMADAVLDVLRAQPPRTSQRHADYESGERVVKVDEQ